MIDEALGVWRNAVPEPTEVPRFVRFVAGPDDERGAQNGTISVIGVELCHNSLSVIARRVVDEEDLDYADREHWMHCESIADELRTEYVGWGVGGSGSPLGLRTHDEFYPAPPAEARTLTASFGDGLTFSISL